MSKEGISNGNNRSERGPSLAAQQHAIEHRESREAEMSRLEENLIKLQHQIIKLEGGLQTGPEHAVRQGDAMTELGIQLRNANKAEIEKLNAEKELVEQAIQGKGGNPSDYTVQ